MKKRFTQEQIAFVLRQAEGGVPVAEVVRRMSISEPTFCRWKKKYAGWGVAEIRRLKQLEDANKRPPQTYDLATARGGRCPTFSCVRRLLVGQGCVETDNPFDLQACRQQ